VRRAVPLRIRLFYPFVPASLCGQYAKIVPAIIIDEKDQLTVIATLDNVVGVYQG
jgi:hypothetical protein